MGQFASRKGIIQDVENKRNPGAFTLWIEVRGLEVVLRQVNVPGDCPELQTEDLTAVLELLTGALTVDLTGELSCQDIRSCREHTKLGGFWPGIIRPFSPLNY